MNIPRPVAWILFALPWLGVLALGFFLAVTHVPLSGVRAFDIPLDGQSPWFDAFLPGQRATEPGPQPEGFTGQRITADPVYAGVRLPGAYDRLAMTLEAQTVKQPLLEIGILRDAKKFQFEMQPLYSSVLSYGWREVEVDGIHGFVRDQTPDDAIVNADPDKMLVWYATSTAPQWMDHPVSEQTVSVSLRGSLDISAIPTDGALMFRIAVQDMNRTRGKNTVAFQVTKDDKMLWTQALGVGGSMDELPNRVAEETIRLTDLTPGVYKLSVIADDDIFIRSIKTTARHWVVGPRLYLGDNVGYSTTTPSVIAWTNSRHTVVETFHNEGAQTVTLGSANVQVEKTHQSYILDRNANQMDGARELHVPKGDLRVIGDGYFAFSPDALFLPQPRRLTDASDPVREGIIAIRTPYHQPETTTDGWVRMSATFDLPTDSLDAPKFSLSAPGMALRSGSVYVRRVGLTYIRPPLGWNEWWKYIRREGAAAWHRL